MAALASTLDTTPATPWRSVLTETVKAANNTVSKAITHNTTTSTTPRCNLPVILTPAYAVNGAGPGTPFGPPVHFHQQRASPALKFVCPLPTHKIAKPQLDLATEQFQPRLFKAVKGFCLVLLIVGYCLEPDARLSTRPVMQLNQIVLLAHGKTQRGDVLQYIGSGQIKNTLLLTLPQRSAKRFTRRSGKL